MTECSACFIDRRDYFIRFKEFYSHRFNKSHASCLMSSFHKPIPANSPAQQILLILHFLRATRRCGRAADADFIGVVQAPVLTFVRGYRSDFQAQPVTSFLPDGRLFPLVFHSSFFEYRNALTSRSPHIRKNPNFFGNPKTTFKGKLFHPIDHT